MQPAASDFLKFSNPSQAGVALADALAHYRRAPQTIVLAIVRGGVPLGVEVARALDLPLDLIVLRAIFQRPDSSVVRIVRVAGQLAQDELVEFGMPAIGSIESIFLEDAINALLSREVECRGSRPPRSILGQTVILVDNGMRTGGTMQAAIAAVRELGAARVVAATPVGAAQTRVRIAALADETICLNCPEPFIHVGVWYRQFEVPTEREIAAQLQSFDTSREIVD